MAEGLRRGGQFSYEHRIILPNGDVRWVTQVNGPAGKGADNAAMRRGTVQDITVRNLAARELRESEERYRSLIEDQSEFVSRYTPDGTLTFVNAAYSAQHGMTPDEMVGMNIFDFLPHDEQARVRRYVAELGADTPFDRIENRVVMPDGTLRWQEWTDRAFVDDTGQVNEIKAFGRDVTERKENEEIMRRGEARLVEAQQIGNVGSWTQNFLGDKQIETHWSGQLCRIYGIEPGDVPQDFSAFLEFIHPDEREDMIQAWQDANDGGESYDIEHRIIRPDGDVRHAHTKARFITEDTKGIRRCVGATSDITARKEMEGALRDREQMLSGIFETASVGLTLTDPDGRFLQTNLAYQTMLGRSAEELLNMTFWDVTHESDQDLQLEKYSELVAGDSDSYQINKRYIHKNGSVIWVNLNVSRLTDDAGNMIGDAKGNRGAASTVPKNGNGRPAYRRRSA